MSSTETLSQPFYCNYQKQNESIVEYSSGLEKTISRAIHYDHIAFVAKDGMLRSKQFKHSTRHLNDSVKDFHLLLKGVRNVEQEEISIARPSSKPKVVQQRQVKLLMGLGILMSSC